MPSDKEEQQLIFDAILSAGEALDAVRPKKKVAQDATRKVAKKRSRREDSYLPELAPKKVSKKIAKKAARKAAKKAVKKSAESKKKRAAKKVANSQALGAKAKKVTARRVAEKPRVVSTDVALVLVHEQGVDWRIDCYQGERLTDQDERFCYEVAIEVFSRVLLKLLASPMARLQEIRLFTSLLDLCGARIPRGLVDEDTSHQIDCDFWGEQKRLKGDPNFTFRSTSYLWAYPFEDYPDDYEIFRVTLPAFEEASTDLMFLAEESPKQYPGLKLLGG